MGLHPSYRDDSLKIYVNCKLEWYLLNENDQKLTYLTVKNKIVLF